MKSQIGEAEGESLFSYNWVRVLVIGAIFTVVPGLALGQEKQEKDGDRGHTVPPIIIKSVEDADDPIEIESARILEESAVSLGKTISSPLDKYRYTLDSFGKAKYVEVFWETTSGEWESKSYSNDTDGLVVKIWLQRKKNGTWTTEPGDPYLEVGGTTGGFNLTSDRLSSDKKNRGNPHQRRKRSFNKNRKWRIGRVQVGDNAPVDAITYMVVEFQDHIH